MEPDPKVKAQEPVADAAPAAQENQRPPNPSQAPPLLRFSAVVAA